MTPGNVGITSPPSRTFNAGERVTLRAIPGKESGYLFDRWTGDVESRDNPARFVIETDLSVVAHFVGEPRTLTISIQGEGVVQHRKEEDEEEESESVFSEQLKREYKHSDRIELLATPDPGWEFVQWRGENFTFNRPSNPVIMEIWDDQELTAIFREVSP